MFQFFQQADGSIEAYEGHDYRSDVLIQTQRPYIPYWRFAGRFKDMDEAVKVLGKDGKRMIEGK